MVEILPHIDDRVATSACLERSSRTAKPPESRLLDPARVAGEPAVVLAPYRRWEGNRRATWFWNEGPAVTWRDGRYWMLYSVGYDGDRTYGVGLAAAVHPGGPWTKHPDNPLLVTGRDVIGPGHVCLAATPDGQQTLLVHHGHVHGRRGRAVFVDVLTWNGDRFDVEPFDGASPPHEPSGTNPTPPPWARPLRDDASKLGGSTVREGRRRRPRRRPDPGAER